MNLTNISPLCYDICELILKKIDNYNKYYLSKNWNLISRDDICNYSAENGFLDLLKWARKNECPWDEHTCSFAAYSGHLEMLKYLHENGMSFG